MQQEKNIYSVSRLNTEARQVIEGSFPLVWVEGEISGLSTPRSGHMYFSLKDPHAQVRCALFRFKRQALRFLPAEGMQVLLRARLTLYEARGDFQLVVEHMEAAGEGQLRQAIERLKLQLQQEGLFDQAHKKPLPGIPRRIGVITSPSGAAIRDVLQVLERRFPAIEVNIYPVPVQGEHAARQISDMLCLADRRNENDLLILTRGGGSLEDLMAFNDEQLARTLFALQTPVISAVGHEIDTSICDFVADRRAPTPSAAAELASPDQRQIRQQLKDLQQRLHKQWHSQQRTTLQQLRHLQQRLSSVSPAHQLQLRFQSVDMLEQRLQQAFLNRQSARCLQLERLQTRLKQTSPRHRLQQQCIRLQGLTRRLQQCNPLRQLPRQRRQLADYRHQLQRLFHAMLEIRRQQLSALVRALDTVSPLQTLQRGFAIVQDDQGNVVKSVADISSGQQLVTRLHDGSFKSHVE